MMSYITSIQSPVCDNILLVLFWCACVSVVAVLVNLAIDALSGDGEQSDGI